MFFFFFFLPPYARLLLVSRREIYCNRLYDEMARKVIIEHERMEQQKKHEQAPSLSEYIEHYTQTIERSVIGNDSTKHDAYPLYKINDALTFWSMQKGKSSKNNTSMGKNTEFSKPICEQLDTQFH